MKQSQTIRPEQLQQKLGEILVKFDEVNKTGFDKVMTETTVNMFGAVIEMTPVGPFEISAGWTKAAWIVSYDKPSTAGPGQPQPNRNRNDVERAPPKHFSKGGSAFLTNNQEHINVLEYGGYPVPVKMGTRLPSGDFEIRSSGGFSKQAPKGMVRINLSKLSRFLTIAANKVFGG